MKCIDCAELKIVKEPRWACGDYFDWGRAICTKHYLVMDYMGMSELREKRCVEELTCEKVEKEKDKRYGMDAVLKRIARSIKDSICDD